MDHYDHRPALPVGCRYCILPERLPELRRNVLRVLFSLLLVLCLACCHGDPKLSRLPDGALILAFGDSITAGVGAPPGSGYPEILETLIDRRVVRSGLPGETSMEGVFRLPEELAAYKPNLVLLCLGGNDLLRRMDSNKTAASLARMVQMIRNAGAEVVLIGVPEPGLLLSTARIYRKVATDLRVPLEGSLLPDILADDKLKADPIHPNADGYYRLAQGLADFLRKNGAVP